jgi:hypothetical protein
MSEDNTPARRARGRCTATGERSKAERIARDRLTGVDAQLDLFAGRAQSERGMDSWWSSTAMQAVRAMAATGRVFQAFDLVETCGIPEPDHPNRWGALLTRAARNGVIVAVGAAPSRRPTVAGSLTRTWRGRGPS